MRVLFAASEVFPLIKTGGLADVAGALPVALHGLGNDVKVLMPAYPAALAAADAKTSTIALGDAFGGRPVTLVEGRLPDSGLPVLLVQSPGLFERLGNPYQDETGQDWSDNDVRFGILSWAAARLSQPASPMRWQPDILHLNDWQTGLAPAYLDAWGGPRAGTIFTIHNIAYQGNYPGSRLAALGLPEASFAIEGLEFYGQVSFLKAGLFYSDRITTVSPTYAREIQHAPLGSGMEGLLAKRASALTGILNGADYSVWDPSRDPHLVRRRDPADLDAKHADKRQVQHAMGLAEDDDAPLFVIVSRLAEQKGMDLVLAAIPTLLRLGGQLAVLGTGDRVLETEFLGAAASHPASVGVHIGYSEPLAHRLIAGGDFLLMPSRYEPCGLTQMYAFRYGTLPIVDRVGGLADSVTDASYDAILASQATGFVFDEPTVPSLEWCIERAVASFHRPEERRNLQRAAIRQDFGWPAAARRYLDLYRDVAPNE